MGNTYRSRQTHVNVLACEVPPNRRVRAQSAPYAILAPRYIDEIPWFRSGEIG
jgi:hypothetical protein